MVTENGKGTTVKKLKAKKKAAGGKNVRPRRAKVSVSEGTADVLLGQDDPRTWDDEEILHGRRRDRNGGFRGLDPTVIPRAVHDEMIRRSMRNADRSLRKMQTAALEQLAAIVDGEDVDDKDRINAIKIILERTAGKVPDKIEVSAQTEPWEKLIVDAIVDVEDGSDGDGKGDQ